MNSFDFVVEKSLMHNGKNRKLSIGPPKNMINFKPFNILKA